MYNSNGQIIISIILYPFIKGDARKTYVSNIYTLVNKSALLNSTDDNELKSSLDRLLVNTDVTTGTSSFWVSDPLDAVNNPHLN